MRAQIQFQPMIGIPLLIIECPSNQIKTAIDAVLRSDTIPNRHVLNKAIRRGLNRIKHDLVRDIDANTSGYCANRSCVHYGAFSVIWIKDSNIPILAHEVVHLLKWYVSSQWLDGDEAPAYLMQNTLEGWMNLAFGVDGPVEL